MQTIVELAELCAASYGDLNRVEFTHRVPLRGGVAVCQPSDAQHRRAWSRRAAWRNRAGFFAAVYEGREGGRVLAFRGTDDLWDGLVDDAVIAAGQMPPQVLAALQVVRSSGLGTGACLTGHSLGGALALIAAAHSNLPAVSFNAPGVMDSCVQSAGLGGARNYLKIIERCVAHPRVRNIRINGDPVSSVFTTGLQVGGGSRILPGAQCGLDALCRHGIRTCLEAVRRDAANYESLHL